MSTLLTTQVVHAQTARNYMYERLNTLDFGWELGRHLLIIFIAGALGGFVSFLMNFKVSEEELSKPIVQRLTRIEQELAKQNRNLSDKERAKLEEKAAKEKWSAILKCCLSQSIVGGAAAPPVLLLLKPDNAFALLAMSLVVGTAGSAFFRALQEQMLEYVRREEKVTRQAQIQFKQQSDKVGELITALSENDIERVKEIAEELKGACAANTAAFGRPPGDISVTSTSQVIPVEVSNPGKAYEGNGNYYQSSVGNQNPQTAPQ
ncbi:HMG-box domain-containing protein [Leptolyngbya sp. FACHB-711]|uniref:HMG-box domain-containing protein n=1 Tax=unclassified Leptolyngbya TaxID=2650499 RepID=UPI0016893163|nr:HMG-box domain-containing protein [Leptolyngbya sp. FACHB-711]MBD2024242.1 hypothetical protein [Leptolyngbya sp. FACHB-711]